MSILEPERQLDPPESSPPRHAEDAFYCDKCGECYDINLDSWYRADDGYLCEPCFLSLPACTWCEGRIFKDAFWVNSDPFHPGCLEEWSQSEEELHAPTEP